MTTDSFNPQEILNRLRGKTTSSGNGSGSASFGGISGSTTSLAPPSANLSASQNQGASQSTLLSSGVKSPAASQNMRNPSSLTLTATQRQDNLTARTELEKEIKKLRDDIIALKSENRQLRLDKEDVEKQFIEYKIKAEENITKLRGRVAKVALQKKPSSIDGTGKMYPPHQSNASNKTKLPPQPPMEMENEGFRDPTFSELMRRSTPIHADFRESLRKAPINNKGVVTLAVPKSNIAGTAAPSSSGGNRPENSFQPDYGSPNANHFPSSTNPNPNNQIQPNSNMMMNSIPPPITSNIMPFSSDNYNAQSLDYYDNNNYRTKRANSGNGMDDQYRGDEAMYDTSNLPVVEIDLSK